MNDNYLLSVIDRAGNSSEINITIEVHHHIFVDGECIGCGCSEALINNWDYVVDENAKTVQLTNYKGESNDVVIDGVYKINGKNYNTILNSHYEEGISWESPFEDRCFTIKSIIINNGVTAYDTSGLFANCAELESLNISGLNTSNVEDMNHMFYECGNLKILNIETLDTSKVISIYYMFGYNTKELYDLSMLDFSNVIDANCLFNNCINAKKIIIPPSLKILGDYCFTNCKIESIGKVGSGASLEIPNSVKKIGNGCFSLCTELHNIIIPEGVENIGEEILSGDVNVASLSLPSTLKTIKSGDYGIFGDREQDKRNLKTLYYNAEVGDEYLFYNTGSNDSFTVYFGEKVKHLPNIFEANTKVSKIIIQGNVEEIPAEFVYRVTCLQAITLPNTLRTIGSFAFGYCSNLNVTIPNEVTEIDEYAFYEVPQIYYNGSATGSPWGALKVN